MNKWDEEFSFLSSLKSRCLGPKCLRGIQSIPQPPRRGGEGTEEPAGGSESARLEENPQCTGHSDDPCSAHAGKVLLCFLSVLLGQILAH